MLHAEILRFIQDFFDRGPEGMASVFTAGYCWHFAHMLKDTFGDGTCCLAAPFGHFVYRARNYKYYDAYGEYSGEALYFIPEEELPEDCILDFKHIPYAQYKPMTKEQCIVIIKDYCKRHGVFYNSECEDLLK